MRNRTKEFSKQIQELEFVEDRLKLLHDTYSDCKAVILAPGPSLNDYENLKEDLESRDDLVVLSIKQAYDKVGSVTDFHIVNTYNFDKYNGYDYESLDSIIFYGLSESYAQDQLEKIQVKPSPCDIYVMVKNPPYISYEESIHKSGNFDLFRLLKKHNRTQWGTSILYEQAIPMALLLGCKDITTIGWDLTTGVHSYKDDEVGFTPNKEEIEKTNDSIETTKELHEWFEREEIDFKIISDENKAYDKIKRIKSINDIKV
jgi:hypothetical protein|tara:strand:+ start:404 stop:1180 length:777 start_codon:yes stop_codon:yes gene_type:complete